MHKLTALELLAALKNKKISAVELLDETIKRIEVEDKRINAIPVRDFERARETAVLADKARAQGKEGMLTGLPMTVKESFHVVGMPVTWGNPAFKDWQPSMDALMITRLKEAGAIIIGKSNVPCMLGDWQTYNEIYGTTNNPWDVTLTPGGSSGGSAAALAANMISLELGSDLAGSLRAPAHFCGIFAHKPTYGLVPLRGAGLPMTRPGAVLRDFAVAGPMARSAVDLKLALDIMAGPDPLLEGKGYQLALPAARHQRLQDFRVLVINQHPLCPTSEVIQQALENFSQQLAKLGVKVSHYTPDMPDLAEITSIFSHALSALFAADTPAENYDQTAVNVAKLPADDNSLLANYLRGSVCSHRDWLLKSNRRAELNYQWRQLYKDVDIILCPAMPTVAFKHDHSNPDERHINVDGQQIPYGYQITWASMATLFGLPSTSIPIAKTADGLPVGIQVIGDYMEDNTTLMFAKLVEETL